MSLFTRLFKREDMQDGEQPSGAAATNGPSHAATAQLGSAKSPPDATVYIAASAEDAAQPKGAPRAREAAPPPIVPKPPSADATEPDLDPLPPRAGAEPRDAKAMSEKSTKPGDATIKIPEAGRTPAGDRTDAAAGKVPPRVPAPGAAASRPTLPETKAAPRGLSASMLKAAQAAADKRAVPKPSAEVANAKAQDPSPANAKAQDPSPANAAAAPRAGGVAVQPAPRAGELSVQPAPRSVGAAAAPSAGTPASAATPAEPPAAPLPAAPAKPAAPQPSARALFDARAPQLLDALLHLMLELRGSDAAPGDWARDSAAALRTLRDLAAKLDDASLLEALDGILLPLEGVERDGLPRIDGALRDELLRAYASLREHLPAACDPDDELQRREPLLVEQILLQVRGVQRTTLRKLHAAGWSKSEDFLRRTSQDLVRDTGIDMALAERIMSAFRAFRSQFATLVPAPARAEELSRLAALLDELRAQQARFEHACCRFGAEDLRERREQRAARARSERGIYALLARLGELERIAALERAPFQAKIAALTTYLGSANRSTTLVS